MIALEWDPDRYDYLSENRLFLISWCLWDYTEFAEDPSVQRHSIAT